MSRFPLAGLLRLRQVQADVAAGELGRAAARHRRATEAAEQAAQRARDPLAPGAADDSDGGRQGAPCGQRGALSGQQLQARAATALARAGHAATLAEAATATREHAAGTTAAWVRARADLEAVEHLRARHEAARRAERSAAEQRELDDRVAAGWARAHAMRYGQEAAS